MPSRSSFPTCRSIFEAGEEVVIAYRGKPVVRLVPADEASAPAAERGKGRAILEWLSANPLPDYARRSAEEIDASIEEERLLDAASGGAC